MKASCPGPNKITPAPSLTSTPYTLPKELRVPTTPSLASSTWPPAGAAPSISLTRTPLPALNSYPAIPSSPNSFASKKNTIPNPAFNPIGTASRNPSYPPNPFFTPFASIFSLLPHFPSPPRKYRLKYLTWCRGSSPVERGPEKAGVGSSTLPPGTTPTHVGSLSRGHSSRAFRLPPRRPEFCRRPLPRNRIHRPHPFRRLRIPTQRRNLRPRRKKLRHH